MGQTKQQRGFKHFLFSHWNFGEISILTNIFQTGWTHLYSDSGSCFSHVFCSGPTPWNIHMRNFIYFHGLFPRCLAPNYISDFVSRFQPQRIRNRCSGFPDARCKCIWDIGLHFVRKATNYRYLSVWGIWIFTRDRYGAFVFLMSLLTAQFCFD